VGRWKKGDTVCALLGGGGYAEYAAVDPRHALPIPSGLSLVEAAGLPEVAFTVYANLFEHGRLSEGETLLVHGVTSGIGAMTIQMANAFGASVVATGRGPEKTAQARAMGADHAIDTTTGHFAETVQVVGGADVVLDMVGGSCFAQNVASLRTGGRLVCIATQAARPRSFRFL
jgi:NADPH2:quinone reductase